MTRTTVDKGSWIFSTICIETKEVHLFKVDMQGAATLGKNIAESIPPGTTIDCDKWAAYNCIPNLVDAARVDTNYVCESTTQTTLLTPTPMPWQTPMRHLVRNGYKVSSAAEEVYALPGSKLRSRQAAVGTKNPATRGNRSALPCEAQETLQMPPPAE